MLSLGMLEGKRLGGAVDLSRRCGVQLSLEFRA